MKISPNSKDGFLRRSTCFKSNAEARANTTPMHADAKNMRQKRLIPVTTASDEDMSGLLDSRMEVVRTMATASFRMLSPAKDKVIGAQEIIQKNKLHATNKKVRGIDYRNRIS